MSAEYRYFFHRPEQSTATNFRGELQGIYGVNMTRYLSKPGDMTFSVRGDGMINSPDGYTLPSEAILDMTTPFGSSIWVYRNGKLVWSGLVTSRTWQSEGRVFNFTASTHDRYFQSINMNWDNTISFLRQPADVIYDVVQAATDPVFSIHEFIWPHTPGFPFRPTEIEAVPFSGGLFAGYVVLATEAEDAKEFWELIEFALKLGAEYRVVPVDTGGAPPRRAQFQLGQKDSIEADLVGRPSTAVTTTIQYPGSIYRYWWPESVGNRSGAADIFMLRGKDDGVDYPMRDIYKLPSVLRVSRRIDYQTTNQTELDNVDAGGLDRFYPPVTHPTFELDISHPDISVYPEDLDVGDFIKFVINDPIRFGSQAKTGTVRVVGTVLSPPSEGSVEQFGIQLEET